LTTPPPNRTEKKRGQSGRSFLPLFSLSRYFLLRVRLVVCPLLLLPPTWKKEMCTNLPSAFTSRSNLLWIFGSIAESGFFFRRHSGLLSPCFKTGGTRFSLSSSAAENTVLPLDYRKCVRSFLSYLVSPKPGRFFFLFSARVAPSFIFGCHGAGGFLFSSTPKSPRCPLFLSVFCGSGESDWSRLRRVWHPSRRSRPRPPSRSIPNEEGGGEIGASPFFLSLSLRWERPVRLVPSPFLSFNPHLFHRGDFSVVF